ncbi:MAG: NTP transferase domain-containing protein [Acidobacteria bacterium]|nr:NTP transferase domain-containing protein [Acidobacteriota bacterium]
MSSEAVRETRKLQVPSQAIILAGGRGTRLLPKVNDRPKPMAEVGGRPFLEWLTSGIQQQGVREVVLCVSHMSHSIREYFDENAKPGLEIKYSEDREPLGTAGAIRNALDLIDADPVLVLNGDSYCEVDLASFLAWHQSHGAEASLALTYVEDTSRYGRVQVNGEGRIERFDEKGEAVGPGWINAGVYLLSQRLVSSIPEGRPVSLEFEVFPKWAGKRLFGYHSGRRFLDIGTPESYARARAFFLSDGVKTVERCRICKQPRLTKFLSLGEQPHCNSFLRAEQLKEPEPCWPLDLLYCGNCHLVQLSCVVDPQIMFRNYVYVSGTTRTLTAHFQHSAADLVERFQVATGSLVVDIGSNDGTFLRAFQNLGMRTVGVDPATNVAKIANESGIETINDYFGLRVAQEIRQEKGPAQIVTAAGVFFHIDDMDDVCAGVSHLLDNRGVFHVQAIYLGRMLEQTSFDNIYHEHVSYYTLRPLVHLFERFDMSVFHVAHSEIHGGSLLLYVCRRGGHPIQNSVAKLLAEEHEWGWDSLVPYQEFARRVEKLRRDLIELLEDLRSKGKRIAAYGAPAKGNTLLNYCKIGTSILTYAAEKNPLKIGLYTPGMHIPVIDEEEAMKNPPDCFLLLPWNFKNELLQKNKLYRERGGKFIIPIPTPHIV